MTVKKKKIINIISFVLSAVIAAVITVSFIFGAKGANEAKLTKTVDMDGREVFGYCVSDFEGVNSMRYAYYTPDEFVVPSSNRVCGELIDLKNHKNRATKGTYQFVILGLDPDDEDFDLKKEKLKPFLLDDNNWNFHVELPPCYAASCVYYKAWQLISVTGQIKDYEFIKYSERKGYSEKHESATEPVSFDVSLYTKRSTLSPEFNRRAQIITVHYEGEENKASGYESFPLIGLESEVNRISRRDGTLLTVVALLSAFVLFVLAFACFLKKSLFMFPQVLIAAGISGFCLFKLLLTKETTNPYVIRAFVPVFIAVIAVAAVFSFAYALKSQKTEFFIAPPIIITFVISYPLISSTMPVMISPSVWLLVAALLVTVYSAVGFFAELEKKNAYLTDNLQSEVACRTQELKDVISEREKLLRYLSHDLRKPISGIKRYLYEIKRNEENEENLKALDVIEQKLSGVESSLSELQKFSKQSFDSEQRAVVDGGEILKSVAEALKPDCDANGIVLNIRISSVKIYAKRNALSSVLGNLIFNAVEHSECKNIYLSLHRVKNFCKIYVEDDGKGIDDERGIFQPYHGDGGEENLGLGLYICRQHAISMGGNLEYRRKNDRTTFELTLPLA